MNYLIISYAQNNIKKLGIIIIIPLVWGSLIVNSNFELSKFSLNISEFIGSNIMLSLVNELGLQSDKIKIKRIINFYWSKPKQIIQNLKSGFSVLGLIIIGLSMPLLLFNFKYFIANFVTLTDVLIIAIGSNVIFENVIIRRIAIVLPVVCLLISGLEGLYENIIASIVLLWVLILLFIGGFYVAVRRYKK